jgi:lambda family phage tail tape measure protein
VGARLAAVGQAVKERNQVVADANARYDELWNGNLTTFTDGLKKRFAAQRAAEAAVTAGGGSAAGPAKPQVNLQTGDAVGAADSFIEKLKRQVEEQQRGRFEMLRLEAVQKNVSKAAEPYIARLEQIDLVQRSIKRTVEEVGKAEEQRSKITGLVSGGNDLTKGLIQQTDAIGLNADAQRRLTELRKLDELVQRAQVDATSETRAEIEVLAGVLRENLVSALDRAEQAEKDLSGSFSKGAKTAFDDYVKNAYNSNKFAQDLITGGLQKMEDAILNFAKTGKLSFADLFSFMAEEYLRQSIRMSIADFLPGGKGSGGTSLLATAVSFFGHANGLSYVPYDNYPAMLHEGERVLTKAEAGGSGGATHIDASINGLSVGAGVSLAQVNAAVNRAVSMSRESIMRTLRQQQVAA